MKRILLVLASAVALFFAGRAIYRASVSDETRIRWVIEEMCEGFEATRMRPILAGLDTAFVDTTYDADRQLVQAALAQLFFEHRGPEEHAFPYRIEWKSSNLEVEPLDGEITARASMDLELTFLERVGDDEKRIWVANVNAKLRKRDGDWRFVETATTTVEGRRIR